MNLNIDEQALGIRQNQISQAGHTSSPLSSFALSKGAGAGAGRVQDVVSVDLQSSAYGANAYAEKRRGAQDTADMPGASEQKTALDAMVVMSHTLSGEDYARAMEDGYQPGDAETGETVTITDRIKTVMLQSGKEVIGYTDSIDADVLTEITGSTAYANALKNSFAENDLPMDEELLTEAAEAVRQAVSLSDPDDAAVKYMVENRLDPTIRSFYLAESATNGGNASAGGFYQQEGGYLARKAEDIDFDRLGDQIDAVVERAGYTTQEAGEEARWLVANDLPLNEETLSRAMDLERVDFPVDVQLAADAAAAALADGRAATEGNLADPVSLNRKAIALMQRQELEEARLYMSAEANRRLLEKGVQIDTLPMEELIEELKTARAEIAQSLFSDAARGDGADAQTDAGLAQVGSTAGQKYTLFETTVAQVAALRRAPAALVGAERETVAGGTLSAIADKGAQLAARFMQAESTYEAVGTEVRADLGDSIKKAFRNVNDILRELQLEETKDNARAVRILGYNSMEITAVSVEEIREQDAKLRDVTERLKPGAVLALIRDGKNPLNLTLDELKQELDKRGQQGDQPAEKYARFLHQLEKKDGITDEERASYIGIYRLFNTLKKTDHAAIGAVLNEGAEMTIGNLLTATRSAKTASRGIDAKVDDAFGGVDGGYRTPSISAQIESAFNYYSAKADSVYEHISVDGLRAAQPTEETTLPALAEALEAQDEAAPDTAGAADRAYAQAQAKHIRESISGEEAEAAAKELEQGEIPVTPNFIEAMRALRAGRRKTDSVWDALADLSSRSADAVTVREAMETIGEALSDGAQFEEIYKDKTQEMVEDLDRMMEDTGTTIDLQTMLLAKRQLTVATRQADRGSYDIPVEVDGERVNLHVTLREGDGTGSFMTASVPTASHGVLTLSLAMRDGALSGVLNTSEAENAAEEAFVRGLRERFAQAAGAIVGSGVDSDRIHLLYRAKEGMEMTAEPGDALEGDVPFKLAKAFVEAVR